MNKICFLFILACCSFTMSAQSSKDIVGNWRLVSGTDASGKAIDVKAMHKSENVFNVFKEGGVYMHVAGTKVETGTWSLSPSNTDLSVTINGKTTVWKFVTFDRDKTTVTGSPGTMDFIRI